MQRKYIHNVGTLGMTGEAAARAAGYANPKESHQQLKNHPKIQNAVQKAQQAYAVSSDMSRKKVIDGFMEAIDIARLKADPLVMVSGWREIGRMCGFYEPRKVKVDVNHTGSVMLEHLSQLSDAELVQLTLESQPEEGDFTIIDEGTNGEDHSS